MVMPDDVPDKPEAAGPVDNRRVLIVGGYGTFGGRLAALLIDEPRLTLIIAGRSLSKAQAFSATLEATARKPPHRATLLPAVFDRQALLGQQISALAPAIVVDASGPFQGYSGDAYALPRAAIAAGCDYIDLADAAAFVAGIDVLDADAKRAGRVALAGASSFPVLTAAVVRRLSADLDTVDSIDAGIAPSPFAGVGLNVVRAIASYAGRPVRITRDGRHVERPGFVDSRRMTVAVPGMVPLPPIRFALTEVPDLEILAHDWPAARDIWMGAGPTPAILHRLLWIAGKLVEVGLLKSLSPFATLMHRVVNTVRWGEHRGGMIVRVTGRRSDKQATREWHLLAEGETGPFIPSMAAEALIRNYLLHGRPAPGARSAHRDLELADYDQLFADRGIQTGFRSDATATPYQTVLGAAYARLSLPIQALHRVHTPAQYRGAAKVTGASNVVAKVLARVFGFPSAADEVPVRVDFERDHRGVETWRRTFGQHGFVSTQEAGSGRFEHLIVERFGPLAFGLAVVERSGGLHLVLRRWSALGVPMPRVLAPRTTAFEHTSDGRFNFSVDIGLPVLGRLVKYEGWLTPRVDGSDDDGSEQARPGSVAATG
jgi:hypothetical protein